MKRLSLAVGLLLCLLSLLARPARADTLSATILFTMPSNVDPAELYLTQDGHTYSTYGQNESPTAITGSTLLSSNVGGANGLRVHSQIPAEFDDDEVYMPVRELWLTTTYAGDIFIQQNNTITEGEITTTYGSWDVIEQSNGSERTYRFRSGDNSALLNDSGGYAALFTATTNDANFAGAQFSVTGFSSLQPVPEAGTVVTLGGLLALGGAGLRLRRRRGADMLAAASAPEAYR